jgi:hypothetical protein
MLSQREQGLEADFKFTCDCRTCHGNGAREKHDAYW